MEILRKVNSNTWLICSLALALGVPQTACRSGDPTHHTAEALSGSGVPLFAPRLSAEVRAVREAKLAAARAEFERAPSSPDALIWLGRRTAYLGRYREAISIFTKGIDLHPGDARLYRHRGHRFITVRQYEDAVRDLEKGIAFTAGKPDEIEPDGLPNARNIPTSTLQSNLWYHLGLAHYLRGDFERARDTYRECLTVSKNPDMLVATTHWLYMTLRRLGRVEEAEAVLNPIEKEMDIIESGSYHRLTLLYKGMTTSSDLERALDDDGESLDRVTIGYGLGNWHLYNGRREKAIALFQRVVSEADQWPAFGFISAEADLARLDREEFHYLGRQARVVGRA